MAGGLTWQTFFESFSLGASTYTAGAMFAVAVVTMSLFAVMSVQGAGGNAALGSGASALAAACALVLLVLSKAMTGAQGPASVDARRALMFIAVMAGLVAIPAGVYALLNERNREPDPEDPAQKRKTSSSEALATSALAFGAAVPAVGFLLWFFEERTFAVATAAIPGVAPAPLYVRSEGG
jgi:hypothetical protein